MADRDACTSSESSSVKSRCLTLGRCEILLGSTSPDNTAVNLPRLVLQHLACRNILDELVSSHFLLFSCLTLLLKCPTRRLSATMFQRIRSCFIATFIHSCEVCPTQPTGCTLPQDWLSDSSSAHHTILAALSTTATLFSPQISNTHSITSPSHSAMSTAVWLHPQHFCFCQERMQLPLFRPEVSCDCHVTLHLAWGPCVCCTISNFCCSYSCCFCLLWVNNYYSSFLSLMNAWLSLIS